MREDEKSKITSLKIDKIHKIGQIDRIGVWTKLTKLDKMEEMDKNEIEQMTEENRFIKARCNAHALKRRKIV